MSISRPVDHLFDFTPETLRAWFGERGLAPFKAGQVLDWVYAKGVIDPAAMTTLSKRERELLGGERGLTFLSNEVVRRQSATDGTQKLLVEWVDRDSATGIRHSEEDAGAPTVSANAESRMPKHRDSATGIRHSEEDAGAPTVSANAESRMPNAGEDRLVPLKQAATGATGSATTGDPSRQTECVMIPSQDPSGIRRTACISSQVGCPVGCRFCASGIGGLDGNLSAGRIVEQVWLLRDLLRRLEEGAPTLGSESRATSDFPRITNIVFMGMGEPLANFSNVMHAVRTLAAPWGMGISARKITISTVGLPKAIERLAEECELPITLALSLHAPNDTIRRELIPWAEYTSIPELLAACQKWFKKTGREITLEYILLGGVNDQPPHARELARVARTLRANVNLIRYNEVKGMPFARPDDQGVRTFQEILREAGVNAHIRASRGRDIAAACGQLRHEKANVIKI